MGGMSTDSAKRKKVWDEDIRVYTGYGFKPVALTELMKMAWKVPQFIQAKFGSPDIFRGKNFLILQKIYTFVP